MVGYLHYASEWLIYKSVSLTLPLMENLEDARQACAGADALVITAGAGMGVDSGLPDFRGNEGFWKAYPPYRDLGFPFTSMACPDRFVENPQLGWGFYGHRLNLYRKTEPHSGFATLLNYGQSLPGGCFVFTSNVDGHFQKAGFASDRIVECHGSIHHFQCLKQCQDNVWLAPDHEIAIDERTMLAMDPLPACAACGEVARPNILMFGDWGWIGRRLREQHQRFESWLEQNAARRLVTLEFGAGTAVPTIRHLSEQLSRLPEATLIRVNPREPDVPSGSIGLSMGALEAVRALELD